MLRMDLNLAKVGNMSKRWCAALCIGILLSLPIGYEVIRDAYIRGQIVTHSLRQQEVESSIVRSQKYSDEHDYEGVECAIQFGGHGIAARSYGVSCDRGLGGKAGGKTLIANGILNDEVIDLAGVRLWTGQPSGDLSFALTIWYSVAYCALLYWISLLLTRRSPSSEGEGWDLSRVFGPVLIGGMAAWAVDMVMLLIHGDLLVGMAAGVGVAWYACKRMNRYHEHSAL